MTTLVIKSSTELDKNFIKHLSKYMIKLLPKFINRGRLKAFDKYLADNVFLEKRKYKAYQILIMGVQNLIGEIDKSKQVATLQINPNITIPYYDQYKVMDLCAFINNGNLDLKGTLIITKLFRYVKDNINQIKSFYDLKLI